MLPNALSELITDDKKIPSFKLRDSKRDVVYIYDNITGAVEFTLRMYHNAKVILLQQTTLSGTNKECYINFNKENLIRFNLRYNRLHDVDYNKIKADEHKLESRIADTILHYGYTYYREIIKKDTTILNILVQLHINALNILSSRYCTKRYILLHKKLDKKLPLSFYGNIYNNIHNRYYNYFESINTLLNIIIYDTKSVSNKIFQEIIDNDLVIKALFEHRSDGYNAHIGQHPIFDSSKSLNIEEIKVILNRGWRTLIVPNRSSKSTNKVISYIQNKRIPQLVRTYIRYIHFTKVITYIPQLKLMCAFRKNRIFREKPHINFCDNSNAVEINACLSLWAEHAVAHSIAHIYSNYSMKKIEEFANQITDYLHSKHPNIHQLNDKQFNNVLQTATLTSITKQSIEWHERIARDRTYMAHGISGDMLTTKPLIDLPEIEGLKFLTTAEEIIDLGIDQHHCIASYAKRACDGDCHIFSYHHTDKESKKESTATIEISNTGQIGQIKGPYNAINEACSAIRPKLQAWLQKWPKDKEPIILI